MSDDAIALGGRSDFSHAPEMRANLGHFLSFLLLPGAVFQVPRPVGPDSFEVHHQRRLQDTIEDGSGAAGSPKNAVQSTMGRFMAMMIDALP